MDYSQQTIPTDGQPDPFKQIFYAQYGLLKRKVMALVRDEAIAEDLTQEAFIRLYRTPPEQPDSIPAWLHRVATRLGYDYLNKQLRERVSIEKHEQLHLNDHQQSNEEAVMRQFEQQEVRDWLEELPQRDLQVLMLRYSGYSYNEIADEMNLRPPVVGTLINRATVRLKRQAEAAAANYQTE